MLTEDLRRAAKPADAQRNSHQISWQGDKSTTGNVFFSLIFFFFERQIIHTNSMQIEF